MSFYTVFCKLKYLNTAIHRLNAMEDTLFFYNPWWTKEIPDYLTKEYRRHAYNKVKEYLKLDRIIVVKGPRRVGKTTLLYQLTKDLLQEAKPEEILYIPFDDPKLTDFNEIIDFYKNNILKKPLDQGKTYILLDEIQYLDNWQHHLKKYFDRNYPIKFIATGSSATLIKKGTESLMGRTIEEVMPPFTFKEYLEYHTGKKTRWKEKPSLQQTKEIEEEARIHFNRYLHKGGFPNIFNVEETGLWQKMIQEDVIEKAVYRDITTLYDIKKPELLEKLLLYLTDISGQILNINNISQSIGLSREYTVKYLTYLKNAYLLLTAKKYAKSVEKTIRSNEKAYIVDPGIINALLNQTQLTEEQSGQLVEGVIAAHLTGKEYYYWRDHYEVDFIVKEDNQLKPIEVKYKNNINKKDLKGLLKFMEKHNVTEATVVTKNQSKTQETNRKTIHYTPAWQFLLEN